MAHISTRTAASGEPVTAPRPDSDLLTEARIELKYSVPATVADRALKVARVYLAPDTLALGPRQRVTSLYLDTPHLTFLRWHRERAADRFKLRIRGYGEHPPRALYAEVKRKTGSVVRKSRAPFPADALHAVLEGSDVTDGGTSGGRADDLKAFLGHRSRSGAAPQMLVTCVRESLRDPQRGTAVTIDRELSYQATRRGDLAGDRRAWRPIPLTSAFGAVTTLVEVKYALDPPPWLDAVIAMLAPWRVSFSKYAAAMNESAPARIADVSCSTFTARSLDPV